MTKKIKLVFDATVLANVTSKNATRSGIFVCAIEILKRLKKSELFDLNFYIPLKIFWPLKKAFQTDLIDFKKTPISPRYSCIDKFLSLLGYKKLEAKKQKCNLKKIIYHNLRLLFSILFCIPNLVLHCFRRKDIKSAIFFSPCYAPITKRKSYTIIYDITPILFRDVFGYEATEKLWQEYLTDYMKINPEAHYFSISENTKKDFLKCVPELKPEQITVTPLACSNIFHPCSKEETLASLKKYNLPTDKKYIFSLCSLAPHKNLIRAVKTFVEFIKKNKIDDMVLILGGGHWEEFVSKLDAEIEDLGNYKDKIIKAGYIDDEDLAPLYSGAEWFVYTSQYEGFGLPPLEAMACGCPVITSNNSSLPEVVGDAGIMIDWDSDEQHVKAYEDYYYHPELREKMRQKGLERAKQFSWDRTVDLMIKKMMKDIQ